MAWSKTEFDTKLSQVEALTREWAERECTSFDDAVSKPAPTEDGAGSIWDMPAIDSKRTVSLLVELEPLIGCKLPVSIIQSGGYANVEALAKHLFPKIRECCSDVVLPGIVTATLPTLDVVSPAARTLP